MINDIAYGNVRTIRVFEKKFIIISMNKKLKLLKGCCRGDVPVFFVQKLHHAGASTPAFSSPSPTRELIMECLDRPIRSGLLSSEQNLKPKIPCLHNLLQITLY